METRSRTALLTDLAREELAERIDRFAPVDGAADPLPDLRLFRHPKPSDQIHGVYEPSVCMIAQGRKEVALERRRYVYDPADYLINTVELPIVSRITEASPERPYLALRLRLDPALVGEVMLETNPSAPGAATEVRGLDVSRLDAGLSDAFLRLVRTLDSPQDARVLAPSIRREIVYRLLVGAQGRPIAPPRRVRGQRPPRLPGDRPAAAGLRPTVPGRGRRARGRHERLRLPPSLQGRDRHEPDPVPEAASAA